MPRTLIEFDDEHFTAVDALLANAFLPEGAEEAQLMRGPSFGTWALRDTWDGIVPDGVRMFDQRNRHSPFYFTQKHLHLVAVDENAVAITTSCAGRPIYASMIGSRAALAGFLQEISQRFNDDFLVRWVPAVRAKDALVMSFGPKNVFVPVAQGLSGEIVELELNAYLEFSGLTP